MALHTQSVQSVKELFNELFPDTHIGVLGENKYGADEVFVDVKSIQTRELGLIYDLSRKIGNTVSILQHSGMGNGICICYW